MLLTPTADQEFFRETTARFLAEFAPVEELRRRRDDPAGFDRDYWKRGAELGWTSLLVSEDNGGGSMSGEGVIDLTLIAHEFGRAAAPGPLVAANVVAAALNSADVHGDVLAGLLSGTSVASWCMTDAAPNDRLGTVTLEVRLDGDDVVLDGVKRPVESGDTSRALPRDRPYGRRTDPSARAGVGDRRVR